MHTEVTLIIVSLVLSLSCNACIVQQNLWMSFTERELEYKAALI